MSVIEFIIAAALYGGAMMMIVSLTQVVGNRKRRLIWRIAVSLGAVIAAVVLMGIAHSI